MNEYIKHIGSSVFAVAPGVRNENDFIGSGIFI
jgi:deferrochelatase/peroxidase EfeB